MRTKTLLTLAAALLLMVGCGDATVDDLEPDTGVPDTDAEAPDAATPDDGYSAACGDAVSQLSQVDDLNAAADELDNAISTCENPEAFLAAVDDILDIDGSVEPMIAERCADATADDSVTQSAICAELG